MNNKFEYIKVDNSIVCRYPFNQELQAPSVIGDVYNFKRKKWKTSTSSMRYKQSGEYTKITAEEALRMINITKK